MYFSYFNIALLITILCTSLVPSYSVLGLPAHCVEIPAGHFSFDVRLCSFDAHCADADLDDQGFSGGFELKAGFREPDGAIDRCEPTQAE